MGGYKQIKPRFKKGSKEAIEAGKKSKRHASPVRAMKEAFASGEIDINAFGKAMLLQAMKGNGAIARLALEYLEGKVPQPIEHSGNLAVDHFFDKLTEVDDAENTRTTKTRRRKKTTDDMET